MTSILSHLEDMNSVCQKSGLRFVRHKNKQLGAICIKMEFAVGVHSNNLTQSGAQGEQ